MNIKLIEDPKFTIYLNIRKQIGRMRNLQNSRNIDELRLVSSNFVFNTIYATVGET